jgi:hypothetical protein
VKGQEAVDGRVVCLCRSSSGRDRGWIFADQAGTGNEISVPTGKHQCIPLAGMRICSFTPPLESPCPLQLQNEWSV